MPEPHVDLVGFADGELSNAEADAVRKHLRTCDACTAGLLEVLELTARLSTLSDDTPPALGTESLERHVPREQLAFPGRLTPFSAGEDSMKPESVQQMKRLMNARDLLRNAVAQCTTMIDSLRGALEHAQAALPADEDAVGQITALRELVARLSHETLGTCEACKSLAEMLEVLASEVTAHEEHIPAGVS